MLEYIRDRSQYYLKLNMREARYKIRDRIKQRKLEWKGVLKSRQDMGKGLHKGFKTVVKKIYQNLPPLGEYGSEVSHFIPESRNFSEVKKLSENINKPWLEATLKEIKNIINNQFLLVEDQNEGELVTPCMDVYKAKIQSDRSLDKIKLKCWLQEICRIRNWFEILGHQQPP